MNDFVLNPYLSQKKERVVIIVTESSKVKPTVIILAVKAYINNAPKLKHYSVFFQILIKG